MPISSRNLKQFIYCVPGLQQQERVAELIKRVEQTCTVVNERVALRPEVALGYVNLPIQVTFPPGVVLVPQKDPLLMNLNSGIWHNPSPEPVLRLARLGWVSFGVRLRKFQLTFECCLDCSAKDYKIDVEVHNLAGIEKAERAEKLSQISEHLNLPVAISGSEPTVIQRGGLEASISDYESPEKKTIQAYLKCHVSRKAYQFLMQKLVTEAKGKVTDWQVGIAGEAPIGEVLAEVNRIGFPGKKTELSYWWRIRSHRDFSAMTEMAVITDTSSVAQSLIEFQFTKNRLGQLDVGADKKGGFKLWFSFDEKEHQLEFTQLSGIKLKEDH